MNEKEIRKRKRLDRYRNLQELAKFITVTELHKNTGVPLSTVKNFKNPDSGIVNFIAQRKIYQYCKKRYTLLRKLSETYD